MAIFPNRCADIGIVVDGKIVAPRPVAVESKDYATREYGATAVELNQFEQRTHGEIEKARKEGTLHDFNGRKQKHLKTPMSQRLPRIPRRERHSTRGGGAGPL